MFFRQSIQFIQKLETITIEFRQVIPIELIINGL